MTTFASAELLAEVDAAAKDGAPERRAHILRQIVALFLTGAGRLNRHQVCLFDDVLVRLIERVDLRVLAELSAMLADLVPVPEQTVRRLARHDSVDVAAPILLKCGALAEQDLIEIAGRRGQPYLLAISERRSLSETLTSVILRRAGKDASRALVKNAGARFSRKGYAMLLAAAERDDGLAEALALRSDLPDDALNELLASTTQTVRARLPKIAPAAMRQRLEVAIDKVEGRNAPRTTATADYFEALSMADALNRIGKLNDSTVNRFAIRGEHTNVIASLSLLSGATIESIAPLMDKPECEDLLIACRASRLNWQTAVAILNNRNAPMLSKRQLDDAKEFFETLYLSTAQYATRFELTGAASGKPDAVGNVVLAPGARS
jgi:uncharacterized protein (DUF2336 family)